MLTLQEEREELAMPLHSADLGLDDLNSAPTDPSNPHGSSVLERLAWFRNLSIRGKVHAIFGAFFGVSFAIAMILGLGFSELWVRYQTSEQVQAAVLTSTELRGMTGELRYNSARFIFAGEPEIAERQQQAFTDAQEKLTRVESIIVANLPELQSRLDQTRETFLQYNETFDSVIEVQAIEGRSERSTALAFQLSDQGDGLLEQADIFNRDLTAYSEEIVATGVSYFFTMIAIVAGLAVLAALILLTGLNYLSRDFSRKIVEISGGMTMLAKGNRDFEIEGDDRQDEIGEMLRALNLFKRANQQLEVWARERTERAHETVRLQQEREQERQEAEERKNELLTGVAQQFEQTVGDVVSIMAEASRELGTTAKRMASTAEEASNRTDGLATHMQEANSGATSAAAASDEFALSISEISRQAASSSELARLATGATEEADTTISALSESAEQVGQVVDLIQTIAQRTNLLALNASIEAARGGEAGRGFAVVASEVKELAMQTSRATEEVSQQIRSMQETTGASVSALRAIAGQVKELEATATSIASAVDQQSVAGQDLARSIDLAANGTEKVSGHIDEVRKLSLSTGAAAQQVLTSADELELQAETLNDQVKTFLKQVRDK